MNNTSIATMSHSTATAATFASHDGTQLFYRHWPAPKPSGRALLLIHRGHEHSARWQEMVAALQLEDIDVFAWDQRGHGHSPGERGSAENFGVIIRDLEAFVRHLESSHGIRQENLVAAAHSVGAVALAAWVHDFAPRLRGMILATPAFRVKLYVPLAIPLLRLKQKLSGPGIVKSYVKAKVLTHDAAQARAYSADPAIFRQIAVNILLDLFDTSKRLVADAGAIRTPTLMLAADQDWVVRVSTQRKFFERLGSPQKEFRLLQGFHHAVFHESKRAEVFQTVRDFVRRSFEQPPPAPPSLTHADEGGYTKSEFDQLVATQDNLSARVQKFTLETVGQLSEGIALGWKSGFDSGQTLDYVYENQPRGKMGLGRVIDRAYLNSPGWSGIRLRRKNLESTLRKAMLELHAAGRPVRIVDIACGAGRYVLEAMKSLPDIPSTALLRDYKLENVAAAQRLIESLGLADRAKAVWGDAFDQDSLTQLDPRPTIAIVSGLFELYPHNAGVTASLRGLAAALEHGGTLIYTNQPWHPQLKMIAHVLTNREGQPWIMRRRTQEEMDELAAQAGFVKRGQEIDHWGIFSVSRAQKLS